MEDNIRTKTKNPSKYAQDLIDKGWAIKRAIDRGDREAVDSFYLVVRYTGRAAFSLCRRIFR